MLMLKKIIVATLLLSAFSFHLSAGQCQNHRHKSSCCSSFQVSLCDPVQSNPSDCDVCGVRLNVLYGKNRNVTGLDVGLVNHATGDVKGLEIGVVNIVEGDFTGFQDGFYNTCKNLSGCQNGIVNHCTNKVNGVQRGFVNQAKDTSGVQWGLINFTRNLNGVQIGLINIQKSRKHFRILPIINIASTRMPKECCSKCGKQH